MLRFRNRFKATPSTVATCSCGRRLSFSVSDGREMVIHELPWCERFEALAHQTAAEAGADAAHHVALVNVTDQEAVIIADGDSVPEVRDAAPERP